MAGIGFVRLRGVKNRRREMHWVPGESTLSLINNEAEGVEGSVVVSMVVPG